MPRVHLQMPMPDVRPELPHDPGGKIFGLYAEAMSIVFGAQFLRPADPSNARYVASVERAIGLVEDARLYWVAHGDQDGAGRLSGVLAGFAMELDRFGDALRWLARARKELGSAHEKHVAQNFSFVLAYVNDEHATALQREVLRAWREAASRMCDV